MLPHSRQLVEQASNVFREKEMFLSEGKAIPLPPFAPLSFFPGVRIIPAVDGRALRRTLVYDSNMTANEIALAYFILPPNVVPTSVNDIPSVTIVIPRATVMIQG